MSYTYDEQYQTISFWYAVLEEMNVETQEIIANLLVCGMLVSVIFLRDGNPTVIAGFIAFVQSVNVPRAIRAYRSAKFNREQNTTAND